MFKGNSVVNNEYNKTQLRIFCVVHDDKKKDIVWLFKLQIKKILWLGLIDPVFKCKRSSGKIMQNTIFDGVILAVITNFVMM